MEFIASVLGLIIAFLIYRQSKWNYHLGIIGWFTVFWGFWIICTLITYLMLIFLGFIAKWIFIGLLIFFIISSIKKKA